MKSSHRTAWSIVAVIVAVLVLAVVVLAFLDYRKLPPAEEDTRTTKERVRDTIVGVITDIFG